MSQEIKCISWKVDATNLDFPDDLVSSLLQAWQYLLCLPQLRKLLAWLGAENCSVILPPTCVTLFGGLDTGSRGCQQIEGRSMVIYAQGTTSWKLNNWNILLLAFNQHHGLQIFFLLFKPWNPNLIASSVRMFCLLFLINLSASLLTAWMRSSHGLHVTVCSFHHTSPCYAWWATLLTKWSFKRSQNLLMHTL